MNGCYSLEPSPALLRQSSLSQPYSSPFSRGYDESSGGVAFTILNRYLQGLFCQKTEYETATKRKEDGSKTEFQISIPGCLVPRWLTHQSWGNSISVVLPTNWCNSRWMGFTLCALFNGYDRRGCRARVKAIGDMPHSQYVSKLFFRYFSKQHHVWLLYLSRDDWFSTVGNGECNRIEVVFEAYYGPTDKVLQCGVGMVSIVDLSIQREAEMSVMTLMSVMSVMTKHLFNVKKMKYFPLHPMLGKDWSKGNWRKNLFWLFFRWISRKRD
ncbi:hypothetical protein CMV_022645 [Castanea mollissima]|uniref:C-JID domain-containing protein n=1 Tax=Castanea mollissima TaxID=60419 RepID=A0A8J4QDJ1_9ROSI|nr:hypothetical protein CMV_022645 [Castanea mollissima]